METRTTNPLSSKEDILHHVAQYVDEEFLFFAGVSRRWRKAWGSRRSPLTRAITAHTSPSQLLCAFDCGLQRQWFVCQTVVKLSKLELLQWAGRNTKSQNGWSSSACCTAARAGHLDTLISARASDVPWNSDTCCWAALGGHLHVLQWARANSCPWDSRTCAWAAKGGHLEVLQWCRANGCRWDAQTCSAAAEGGHLEVLQWCKSNGCPWTEDTCMKAVMHGHLPIVAWARDNGCPCNGTTRSTASVSAIGASSSGRNKIGSNYRTRVLSRLMRGGTSKMLIPELSTWLEENHTL